MEVNVTIGNTNDNEIVMENIGDMDDIVKNTMCS